MEEPDETVELVWLKVSSSQATPDELTFTGTITDDADRPRGPTNLTATADGANEIDLTWQAPTDIGTSDIIRLQGSEFAQWHLELDRPRTQHPQD